MQLFEEPLGNLFTEGPAVVVKVEQRREPRVRSLYDTRGMEWDEYGVVIYTAKAKATPVQRGGEWVIPDTAHETRFLKVLDLNGSCSVPSNAGRLLGHFRENGQRYWVFLEKLGAEPSRPASAERQKSAAQSPAAPKAAGASSPAPRAAPQASQSPGSPGKTSAPAQR